MKEIRTEILINAEPQSVWDALTDFESYPDWNPFIVSANIDLQEGKKVEVTLRPPGGKPFAFKPNIIKVNEPTEFQWLGNVIIPGIVDGQHVFELHPESDGKTRFIQREEFTGVLKAPFLAWIGKKTEAGFHQMNQALKSRVEAAA